jgi:hypothetical protein
MVDLAGNEDGNTATVDVVVDCPAPPSAPLSPVPGPPSSQGCRSASGTARTPWPGLLLLLGLPRARVRRTLRAGRRPAA